MVLAMVVMVAMTARYSVATQAAAPARELIGQVHLALTGDPTEMAVTFRTATAVTKPHVVLCTAAGACTTTAAATTRNYRTYGLSSGHFHSAVLRALSPAGTYSYSVG
eukprot:SAG11_NODE_14853_length_597_cov_1.455823_1_plen_107_part_10